MSSRARSSVSVGSSADAAKAAVAAALPASYREALDVLTDPSRPPLSSLSDEAVLELAKDILAALYDRKNEWANVGDWAKEEAKLYKLGGSAADASEATVPFTVAGSVSDYLCTFVEALEYKVGKGAREPELLSKKRTVDGNEVYGPVPMGALYPGNTFEVWTEPPEAVEDQGEEKKEDEATAAVGGQSGKVCIVLGAGNQSMLTIIDVLDNVLRHRRPVLLKHHPLRNWLSGPYGIILEPLLRKGYLAQVADVDNNVTQSLLSDEAVGHVHITGSLQTSQIVHKILQTANPTLSTDEITSMITSELGCATPQIIDDGVYTEKELLHAAHVVTFGKKANCGSNCLCAQVVVLPKHWAQKDEFRSKLYDELKRQPTTPCYYPGSKERKASILEKCEDSRCKMAVAASACEETKVVDADQVVVVECGTPGEEGYNPEPLLTEAFGPILALVELDSDTDGSDGDDYLTKAVVPFLNNKENIFGSLSCSIFTPASKGKPDERAGLQSALASLHYGAVGVNQTNLFGYLAAVKGGKWGAHPSERLGQSGNGLIGDQYGIIGEKGAKTVVYGPSLETKPMFDLASVPPPIVMNVLMELKCSPSLVRGMFNAWKLVVTRSILGVVSYTPFSGLFGKKEEVA